MSTTPVCKRCGICCKKGGPSLHAQDKYLVEEGVILLKDLYTIRQGEMVYDNVREHLQTTDSDIIKIKNHKGTRICLFFDAPENRCQIYENRPIECKALNCQDTREIEQIYSENRLTRKELVSGVQGLWELIEAHQARCDYDLIRNFVKDGDTDNRDASLKNISEMIQYDSHLRLLVVEKGSVSDMTDFLFGRPLTTTISTFGFKFEKNRLHFTNK